MATEVLNQNGKTLDFKGFKPTYEILNDYSHLFDDEKIGTIDYVGDTIDHTIKNIAKVARDCQYQTVKLAKHLKSGNKIQDVFNTWHFITTNIKYHLDDFNIEQIREPARTWRDGAIKIFGENVHGADCEDMAILAETILKNMEYDPYFYIVSFDGVGWGHIYTMLDNMVCDAVMTKFNEHPLGIQKYLILKIDGSMKTVVLGEIPEEYSNIEVLKAPDAITTDFLYIRDNLRTKYKNNPSTYLFNEIAKVNFIIHAQALPERAQLIKLMQHVERIDKNGNLIFYNRTMNGFMYGTDDDLQGIGSISDNDWNEIENIAGIVDEMDEINGIQNVYDAELTDGIDGIGKFKLKNIIKKAKEKIKTVAKNVTTAAKNVTKKVVTVVKKVATAVKDAVIRYNPVTALARGGLLLLLNLNFRGLATKMYLGTVSKEQAIKEGYNQDSYDKYSQAYKKIENMYKAIGGEVSKLQGAIRAGHNKKPLFGGKNLKGIGEPVTVASAAASATPLLVKIGMWLKNLGPIVKGGKNILDVIKPPKGEENSENFEDLKDDKNMIPDENDNTSGDSKNSWLLPAAIGGGALLLIFALK